MWVVAIIEDPQELAKIIEWAKKQEIAPLLSACARSPTVLALLTAKHLLPILKYYRCCRERAQVRSNRWQILPDCGESLDFRRKTCIRRK